MSPVLGTVLLLVGLMNMITANGDHDPEELNDDWRHGAKLIRQEHRQISENKEERDHCWTKSCRDVVKHFCEEHYQEEPCGDGWSRIDPEHCVKFFDSPKTFSDAEGHCQTFGSDLLSVHGLPQMLQVFRITMCAKNRSQDFWIGAKRSGEEFSYLDGSEYNTEASWFSEDPEKFRGPDVCIRSNNKLWGFWSAEDCSKLHKYLCIKKM